MAGIQVNNGLEINAPRAADMRSGKLVASKTVPFESVSEALAAISVAYRFEGLEFMVNDGTFKKYRFTADYAEDGVEEVGGGTIQGGQGIEVIEGVASIGGEIDEIVNISLIGSGPVGSIQISPVGDPFISLALSKEDSFSAGIGVQITNDESNSTIQASDPVTGDNSDIAVRSDGHVNITASDTVRLESSRAVTILSDGPYGDGGASVLSSDSRLYVYNGGLELVTDTGNSATTPSIVILPSIIDINMGSTEQVKIQPTELKLQGGNVVLAPDVNGNQDQFLYMIRIPTADSEAAAISDGIPSGAVYKTSTGELRIKL